MNPDHPVFRSIRLDKKLEECEQLGVNIPEEMFEFIDIMIMGAKKYAPNNWLQKDGQKSSHKDMHASMFRHTAESYCDHRVDYESGKDPLLHLACRALMYYTRIKRGLDERAVEKT